MSIDIPRNQGLEDYLDECIATFELGGQEVNVIRRNVIISKYVIGLSMFDNVAISDPERGDSLWLFRHLHGDMYKDVRNTLRPLRVTTMKRLIIVPDTVKAAYAHYTDNLDFGPIEDTIPDDWLE